MSQSEKNSKSFWWYKKVSHSLVWQILQWKNAIFKVWHKNLESFLLLFIVVWPFIGMIFMLDSWWLTPTNYAMSHGPRHHKLILYAFDTLCRSVMKSIIYGIYNLIRLKNGMTLQRFHSHCVDEWKLIFNFFVVVNFHWTNLWISYISNFEWISEKTPIRFKSVIIQCVFIDTLKSNHFVPIRNWIKFLREMSVCILYWFTMANWIKRNSGNRQTRPFLMAMTE